MFGIDKEDVVGQSKTREYLFIAKTRRCVKLLPYLPPDHPNVTVSDVDMRTFRLLRGQKLSGEGIVFQHLESSKYLSRHTGKLSLVDGEESAAKWNIK